MASFEAFGGYAPHEQQYQLLERQGGTLGPIGAQQGYALQQQPLSSLGGSEEVPTVFSNRAEASPSYFFNSTPKLSDVIQIDFKFSLRSSFLFLKC